MKRWIAWVVVLVVELLAAGRLAADDLERALETRLRGAWALTAVETFSDCAGTYTNNHASDGGVASTGDQRFEAGELVKVDKLALKRSSIDLFLSLAEPVLAARMDGPFELYDERQCRVQLMLELGRPLVQAGNPGPVLEAVAARLELFPSMELARGSESWNRREREAYPPDYEQTLARHAVWQAEQVNAAVAARSEEALAAASSGLDRVRRDPAYLDGFAAGVEALRSWSESDCGILVSVSFSGREVSPPKDKGGDRAWCSGYRDGQETAFNLALLDRLRGCFVPVPPLPAGVAP